MYFIYIVTVFPLPWVGKKEREKKKGEFSVPDSSALLWSAQQPSVFPFVWLLTLNQSDILGVLPSRQTLLEPDKGQKDCWLEKNIEFETERSRFVFEL